MSQTAGRYIAEERGAFDAPAMVAVAAEEPKAVRAPLFEFAAIHDGQPPSDWLRVFYTTYSERCQ